jgi:hypothetical protein
MTVLLSNMITSKRFLFALLLGVTVLSIYACGNSDIKPTPTPFPQSNLFPTSDMNAIADYATQTAIAFNSIPLNEVSILYVIRPDDSRIEFSMSDLESMQITTVIIDGREYRGVRLVDVLEDSRWLMYDRPFSVKFEGKGSLTVPVNQITEDVILVFNEHNLIDLFSPVVDFADLPRDVLLITLK